MFVFPPSSVPSVFSGLDRDIVVVAYSPLGSQKAFFDLLVDPVLVSEAHRYNWFPNI
jgi:hypothetical protein